MYKTLYFKYFRWILLSLSFIVIFGCSVIIPPLPPTSNKDFALLIKDRKHFNNITSSYPVTFAVSGNNIGRCYTETDNRMTYTGSSTLSCLNGMNWKTGWDRKYTAPIKDVTLFVMTFGRSSGKVVPLVNTSGSVQIDINYPNYGMLFDKEGSIISKIYYSDSFAYINIIVDGSINTQEFTGGSKADFGAIDQMYAAYFFTGTDGVSYYVKFPILRVTWG